MDSVDKNDPRLFDISHSVEDNTSKVFDYIDKIKVHKCESLNLKRGRDVVSSQAHDPREYHQKIKEYKKDEVTHDRKTIVRGDINNTASAAKPPKQQITPVVSNNSDDDEWASF